MAELDGGLARFSGKLTEALSMWGPSLLSAIPAYDAIALSVKPRWRGQHARNKIACECQTTESPRPRARRAARPAYPR